MSGGQVTVKIKVTYSGGGEFSGVDLVDANASGDFVYDNHGVSFTLTAEEVAGISASGDDLFAVEFDEYEGSDTNANVSGNISANGNLSTTVSGAADMVFSGKGIVLTATDGQWMEGAAKISISGVDLEVSGGAAGRVYVRILDASDNELSLDTFQIDSGDSYFSGAGTLDYENHGISFNITDFGNTMTLNLFRKSLILKNRLKLLMQMKILNLALQMAAIML